METGATNSTGETQYFTVSQYKFVIMYFMTLGLYSVYWFYKNWKFQQPLMEKNIWPVWRSIFSIFFTHSLFQRVRISAEKKNINTGYSYSFMATMFVTLMVVGNVLSNFERSGTFGSISIVSMFILLGGLYPLYVVQETINNINGDPHGVFNNDITLINYVFIVAGAVLWFSIVLAALINYGIL